MRVSVSHICLCPACALSSASLFCSLFSFSLLLLRDTKASASPFVSSSLCSLSGFAGSPCRVGACVGVCVCVCTPCAEASTVAAAPVCAKGTCHGDVTLAKTSQTPATPSSNALLLAATAEVPADLFSNATLLTVEGGLDSSEDSEDSAQELARNGSNPRNSPAFRSPWSIHASSPAFRSNTELLPPVDGRFRASHSYPICIYTSL